MLEIAKKMPQGENFSIELSRAGLLVNDSFEHAVFTAVFVFKLA